jgi:hypothetical protein
MMPYLKDHSLDAGPDKNDTSKKHSLIPEEKTLLKELL